MSCGCLVSTCQMVELQLQQLNLKLLLDRHTEKHTTSHGKPAGLLTQCKLRLISWPVSSGDQQVPLMAMPWSVDLHPAHHLSAPATKLSLDVPSCPVRVAEISLDKLQTRHSGNLTRELRLRKQCSRYLPRILCFLTGMLLKQPIRHVTQLGVVL